MKLAFSGLVYLIILGNSILAQYNPQKDLEELFVKIQMESIFPDSKTFPDCIPLFPSDTIKNHYLKEKNQSHFNLKAFVDKHFKRPENTEIKLSDSFPPIIQHINYLWDRLIRKDTSSLGSLIGLPHPYIVPGGRFMEMYYWDSYFTLLGIQASGKIDILQNMVDNFAYLIDKYGFIPNGNRTYYLSRSQPPFFSMMVDLLAQSKSDSIYTHYLPELLAEYNFWMEGADKLNKHQPNYRHVVLLPNGSVLNRYWDNDTLPRAEAYKEDVAVAKSTNRKSSAIYRDMRAACESGWDFSSRWFADGVSLSAIHTTDLVAIDLNCLLAHLEWCLVKSFTLKGDSAKRMYYLLKAKIRERSILKYCWNSETGFFTDYDFIKNRPTNVLSLAGLFPMFFRIADKTEAQLMADKIEKYFLHTGGLLTTLSITGQQWDAPNGWAPLQWISYVALKNYDYSDLANRVKEKWENTVNRYYNKSGKLMEKYNVQYPEISGGGGEYPSQDGFGWTNGVYLKMIGEKQ